ncbi:multifunctional CCA addition/repair protein [Candidatus Vallotiella sp. (ex Adelges kitamiensis)]|uniref:multifunctional CCA addition/repair protein n=1 Tax=Candidatus Vallotiella sp. (ex Adelges kitamiensis) TaxID=2864217 RepID=UPI001CE35EF9|nr:multifunctional CCA addition/repair protein [Candidatus Vallotia sp. (ex Adelges kitamiensis)]
MNVYVVGGAIRDELLGTPPQDRDYVVVGATPGQMIAQGFRPVGKSFPVFLHPRSQEEYALARTEHKTAAGYHGFHFSYSPDVTLEEDLARRDLTINAMARAVSCNGAMHGPVIDPFNGQMDLQSHIFRHVSDAFAEDPVRILRVARFATRFTNFSVAPQTLLLMRKMVAEKEVEALAPERIWQEFARGLMECKPSRMFDILRQCGALEGMFPEIERLFSVSQRVNSQPESDIDAHVMMVIDYAAARHYALPVRFAILAHNLGEPDILPPVLLPPIRYRYKTRNAENILRLCKRLRVPSDCRDLAVLVAHEYSNVQRAMEMEATALLHVLERSDALRKPNRFIQALQACEADFSGRLNSIYHPYPQAQRLLVALTAVRSVDAGAVAYRAADKPARIKEAVHAARVQAIECAIREVSL